ncbi:MAG: ABC transporter substrate-binding protein [Acetobacteraceae bacterium]|nr:ABC transporter substrate-binding protein [Acetobacteraceae bacterium]
MTMELTRRAALALAGGALAMPNLARAQAANMRVRFTLEWALQGPYAFAIAGERQGFFREAGLDISIVRGFGAGRVPIDIAAGTYDMGFGDITPTIRFMAENPQRDLVVVAVLWDQSPVACTVRADGPITEPRLLSGRTLAAPEFDGGRQMFPLFARAVGIDPASITWMTVTPELREPMLVQRRADGITGFVTSTGMSLKALGMDWPQQRIFRYREAGLDFYSGGLITTRTFLRERPEAVRAVVASMMRAMAHAYRNPDAAIADLRAREGLTDVAVETERQQVMFREMLVTDNVRTHGMSHVEAPRLARQIQSIREAFNLAQVPSVEQVYTDAFLPPPAQRRLTPPTG